MKISVIGFNDSAKEAIDRFDSTYSLVSICDPDLNGMVYAQYTFPGLEYYADPSEAIRSKCDAVMLTVSDNAPQLALMAIAYKKRVMLARGVDLGEYNNRIVAIAKWSKVEMEFDV
jgi:hypothetical protein